MTFRGYFVLMAIATLCAWSAWIFVLLRINPEEAGILGLGLFFLTLCFSLIGTFVTVSMTYRVSVLHRPVILREARIAFRQAIFLALAACLLLFFASQDVLYFWTVSLVFLVFGGAEYLSSILDRRSRA